MSWSVSKDKVPQAEAVQAIKDLEPQSHMDEHAKAQLEIAKVAAVSLLDAVRNDPVTISISGHSQVDNPGSANDSIYINVYGSYVTAPVTSE